MVARELRSGRLLRLWRDELLALRRPPFDGRRRGPVRGLLRLRRAGLLPGPRLADAGADPRPVRRVPGRDQRPADSRAARACSARCSGTASTPWPPTRRPRCATSSCAAGRGRADERRAILDYCQADVDALAALLPRMLPGILGRQRDARDRARPSAAAGPLHGRGCPHGVGRRPDRHRHAGSASGPAGAAIKARLIEEVDARYGVYEGIDLQGRPLRRLPRRRRASPGRGCPPARWRSTTTRSATRPRRGRRCSRCASCATPWASCGSRPWRSGSDGRNRCLLSAFRSRTGRNQPSNSKFIFGPATWLRSLIRPEPGMALAYVDFSSQEMGIAAALSGDPALLEAYRSGDVYLSFAKQAGLAPPDATKATPRRGARPLQGGGAGHALRHGAGDPGPPHRPAALRGPGAAARCTGQPTRGSGAGRRRRWRASS